jgi:pimeloyl-ACP methyl ester carboxylesterase
VTRGAAVCGALLLGLVLGEARAAAEGLSLHAGVPSGEPVRSVTVEAKTGAAGAPIAWSELSRVRREPGTYVLRARFSGAATAIEVPPCAGRVRVAVDGAWYTPPAGPFLLRVPATAAEPGHELALEIAVSGYERRIACGEPPRAGTAADVRTGFSTLTFASPAAARGGGTAVVWVPPGHDTSKPGAVLVGLHPWNGTPWTYAAYGELVEAARAQDMVLLFPSGLGNSLYVRDAEDEVLRAMDALERALAVDRARVSVWGASMGGAGATTIGLHRPDRFASITSFFGDAKYDLRTYVKSILRTPADAHLVDAVDVADNARHVPVWLVHGEADRVSPIAQSEVLDAALRARGYAVRFDRVPGLGHEGALVARFAAEVVERAAKARAPARPARVTYVSVRPEDTGAYGVRMVRGGPGDARVDVALENGTIRVLDAKNVRSVVLEKGALGARGDEPIAGAAASLVTRE